MRLSQALALAATATLAVGCPNPDNLKLGPTDAASGRGGSAPLGGAGVFPGTGGSLVPAGGAGGAGGSGATGGAVVVRDGGPSGGTGAGSGGTTGGVGGTPGTGGAGTPGTGGTGTPGTGGSGGAERAQACQQYSEAWSQLVLRCSPTVVAWNYGTTATHRARLQIECNLLDLPGVNWPPRPIAACLSAIASFSCVDWMDGKIPAPCLTPGSFADGADCAWGGQCQSRNCEAVTTTSCGVCLPTPQLGEDCEEFCDVGLYCGAGFTCERLGDVGQPCGPEQFCRQSLACVAGTCRQRLAPGAACTEAQECNVFGGVICNTEQSVCVNVSFGPMCGANANGSLVGCAGAGFCNVNNGSCTPPAAEGAACNEIAGPLCMPPAVCDGTCQLPRFNPACRPAAGDLPRTRMRRQVLGLDAIFSP